MTRVVETAVGRFEDQRYEDKGHLKVEKVVTKTPEGAQRYRQIMKDHGCRIAVPSIVINGKPVFDTTPGVEELQQTLKRMVENR
jgi:hypothetical protein